MKKILLLVARQNPQIDTAKRHRLFAESIKNKDRSVRLTAAALDELVYLAGDGIAKIYHPIKGFDLKDFDLVVFKTFSAEPELAIVAQIYLRMHQRRYLEDGIPDVGVSKHVCAFNRQAHRLPHPLTLYARPRQLITALRQPDSPLKPPYIVKDTLGRKGHENYLCQNIAQVSHILKAHPEIGYVVQRYIVNDGDWRLLVLGNRVRLAMRRTLSPSSHKSNALVAFKELVSVSSVPPVIRRDAIRAVRAERLTVAGVDIVIDKDRGDHYILEVNRGPQLDSGRFIDQKMECYSDYLLETVKKGSK